MPKIRKLKIQLSLAIFLLITLSISGIFIFGPSLVNIAKALTGDYNRAVSGVIQLTSADWDLLDEDFVAKSGGADAIMTGPLTLPAGPTSAMQAATKQYVDMKIYESGTGRELKMVCGTQSPSWSSHDGPTYSYRAAHQHVDTSSANFRSGTIPRYFSILHGTSGHWRTTGANSFYGADHNSYDVYIYDMNEPPATSDIGLVNRVNGWGWYISWCGIGESN